MRFALVLIFSVLVGSPSFLAEGHVRSSLEQEIQRLKDRGGQVLADHYMAQLERGDAPAVIEKEVQSSHRLYDWFNLHGADPKFLQVIEKYAPGILRALLVMRPVLNHVDALARARELGQEYAAIQKSAHPSARKSQRVLFEMIALQVSYAGQLPALSRPPLSYAGDARTGDIAMRMGAIWGFVGGVMIGTHGQAVDSDAGIILAIASGLGGAILGAATAAGVSRLAVADSPEPVRQGALLQHAVALEFAKHAGIINCVAALNYSGERE